MIMSAQEAFEKSFQQYRNEINQCIESSIEMKGFDTSWEIPIFIENEHLNCLMDELKSNGYKLTLLEEEENIQRAELIISWENPQYEETY